MLDQIADAVAAVQSIQIIPKILNLVCRTSGMRFAAVARVTEDRWVACSVRDDLALGLGPGSELDVERTICHDITESGKAVVIDDVAKDPTYCRHGIAIYGLKSYVSMPIRLADGSFFGTLCAIDTAPHPLNTPETIEMFETFAEIIGFHLSSIDRANLTEAKLTEERQSSALREQFIAVLGHDLRNPLTAINGGMQILLKTRLDEKATRVVNMIRGSADRMAGLVDNVMDFARGRLGGGLSLDRNTSEPVEPILRQVVLELRAGAPHRLIDVLFDITAPIYSDCRRIAQLASNLLSNALTYGSAEEPVRFRATTTGGFFELSVSNAGEPIPNYILQTIFEPFHRRDSGNTREGLGLGLYISYTIAEAHGGKLEVSSTSEETRFTFRMPVNEMPLLRLRDFQG